YYNIYSYRNICCGLCEYSNSYCYDLCVTNNYCCTCGTKLLSWRIGFHHSERRCNLRMGTCNKFICNNRSNCYCESNSYNNIYYYRNSSERLYKYKHSYCYCKSITECYDGSCCSELLSGWISFHHSKRCRHLCLVARNRIKLHNLRNSFS